MRATCDAPVVAMTLAEDDDGISGALEAGADDYLAKPFDLDQLLARLRAVLWRAPGAQAGALPPFESDELCIDFASAEVAVGGRPVAMSASEFRLLRFLARNRDRVFTPAQLVEEVWGPEYAGDRHLARAYVRRVRRKIERDPGDPRHLVTKPGVGYMLRQARLTAAPWSERAQLAGFLGRLECLARPAAAAERRGCSGGAECWSTEPGEPGVSRDG